MCSEMYTNIKRYYSESGRASPYVILTYINWSYSRNSVKNVQLLWEEIQNDFPKISPKEVFLVWKKTSPREVCLSFSVKREQFNHIKDKYEELPKEIIKFRRVMSCNFGSIKKVYTIEEGETTYIDFAYIRWGNPANTLDVYFSILNELKTKMNAICRMSKRNMRSNLDGWTFKKLNNWRLGAVCFEAWKSLWTDSLFFFYFIKKLQTFSLKSLNSKYKFVIILELLNVTEFST